MQVTVFLYLALDMLFVHVIQYFFTDIKFLKPMIH